jgi:hypothetical protein
LKHISGIFGNCEMHGTNWRHSRGTLNRMGRASDFLQAPE